MEIFLRKSAENVFRTFPQKGEQTCEKCGKPVKSSEKCGKRNYLSILSIKIGFLIKKTIIFGYFVISAENL